MSQSWLRSGPHSAKASLDEELALSPLLLPAVGSEYLTEMQSDCSLSHFSCLERRICCVIRCEEMEVKCDRASLCRQ